MEFDQEQIARLAYQIWEAGGRRPDSQEEDWLCAEQQLRDRLQGQNAARPAAVDESVKESFPASDPPSTHTPDIRPVNADAKWAAASAAAEAKQNEAAPDRVLKARNERNKSSKARRH